MRTRVTLDDGLDDLDDLEHRERISDTRSQLLAHLAGGIQGLQHAATTLERLRSNTIHDVELLDGRDGGDVARFLDDAIRYGRAAYAVVHTVIDQETP